MQSLRQPPRLTNACADCRERKVKCSGGRPCKNCQRLHKTCLYPPSRRGKRSKALSTTQQSQKQNQYVSFGDTTESTFLEATTGRTSCATMADGDRLAETGVNDQELRTMITSPLYPTHTSVLTESDDQQNQEAPSAVSDDTYRSLRMWDNRMPVSTDETNANCASTALPQSARKDDDAPGAVVDEEFLIPLHKLNWEYHGPWSWASVCSPPGVQWVCERTKSDEFVEIANYFMKDWSKHLKVSRSRSLTVRHPEPDPETAWKYVNGVICPSLHRSSPDTDLGKAYFENSTNAIFGMLLRPAFESRLRHHFETAQTFPKEDPAWFALRNVVYATGCRCLLAESTSLTYAEAENQAAPYFWKALSVFCELIFGHSGLTAVQAVSIMAFYASGLASPCLEYPMCKNAVQLAQAKGLHREPSGSWGLSTADLLTRNWLWWTIYTMDKQLALRSGRPSSIQDEDISTPIPTEAPPGSGIDVEMATLIIKHAQICSQISSRITSVKASKQGFSQAHETVRDIHSQLERLLERIPPELDLASADAAASLKPSHRLLSAYLYSDVYATVMQTHVMFFYPWISFRLGSDSDPLFRDQVQMSATAIANAARLMIRQLKVQKIDICGSAFSMFFHPLYAFINLFIYVLKYPQSPTTKGDLALLDVAAGHFGQLDHTSEGLLSFQLPRECIALCSKIVRASKDFRKGNCTVPATPQSLAEDRVGKRVEEELPDATTRAGSSYHDDMMLTDPFETVDFDAQLWSIFGSIDPPCEFSGQFGGIVDEP